MLPSITSARADHQQQRTPVSTQYYNKCKIASAMFHCLRLEYFRFGFCVRRRKNALLIQIGIEIVWDNERINGSCDVYLASPADFAGADDIITNLVTEREPGT